MRIHPMSPLQRACPCPVHALTADDGLRAHQKAKKIDQLDEQSLASLRETKSLMQFVDETLDR